MGPGNYGHAGRSAQTMDFPRSCLLFVSRAVHMSWNSLGCGSLLRDLMMRSQIDSRWRSARGLFNGDSVLFRTFDPSSSNLNQTNFHFQFFCLDLDFRSVFNHYFQGRVLLNSYSLLYDLESYSYFTFFHTSHISLLHHVQPGSSIPGLH